MKTPHKHAELIKAWADWSEIEFRLDENDKWEKVKNPQWINEFQYRIKPEPKPDMVQFYRIEKECNSFAVTRDQRISDNLKLTFDGNTNKLIKAEVI